MPHGDPYGTGDTSIKSYNFFFDGSVVDAGAYTLGNELEFIDATDPDHPIKFVSKSILFSNDAVNDIYFSFDGVTDHGRIQAGETLQMDHRRVRGVWIRGTPGDLTRIWAW